MAQTETGETVNEIAEAQPAGHSRRSREDRAGLHGWLMQLWRNLKYGTVDNPVLIKEFRTRMRGARAYWILLAYTLLLAGVVAMMYFGYETSVSQAASNYGATVHSQGARDLGRMIYYFIFVAQAVMVALITPAITSGALTIEREQRSYELLVTTPLRPADVIRGKLTAAVSFVVLLLTASLPLVSLSFLVGGISPAEIFFSYLIIALSAFLYGAIGIFWSATLRTTAAATVVTYLTVLSFFILTVIPGGIASAGAPSVTGTSMPFQSVNPITATFRAVQPEHFFWWTIPSWIGSTVLTLLLGLVAMDAANGRLEHFDPPKPWWTRLLATLLWSAFALFLFGPIMGGTWGPSTPLPKLSETVAGMLVPMVVLVILVVPVYNTGDLIVRRGESALGRYLSGFLPHRMLSNDLSCGLPLTLLWAVVMLALVPIGLSANTVNKAFNVWDSFLPGLILCVAVVFGLAGVGNLLSVSLPSRWAACILTYLAAVVMMLLPYFVLFPWSQLTVKPKTPQLLYQVLYLIPFEALRQLGNPSGFWNDFPALLFGTNVPIWTVTSTFYLSVGALCFLITGLRVHQEGKILQQRMEATEKSLQSAPA